MFSLSSKKLFTPVIWICVLVALWGSLTVSRSKKGSDNEDAANGGTREAVFASNDQEAVADWQTSFSPRGDASPASVDYPAWQIDKERANPVFDWKGGIPEQSAADPTAVRRHIAFNEDPNTMAMEFETDAPQWELFCAPNGSGWRVLMHNVGNPTWQVVGNWKSPEATSQLVQKFHQKDGVRKLRRWRVEYGNQLALGVRLQAGETIAANPANTPLKRVVWCGDSFVEGVGASSMWQGFAGEAGAILGLDSQFDASGGTGYIASGPPDWHRRPFGERISNIVQAHPSVVVIYGSTNDALYPPQDVAAAAHKFWAALRQALPAAKIIVIGPIQPSDNWKLKPLSQALQSEAAKLNLSFIDATSWIHGTGKVGNTRGDGDADIYTSADGVHPTPAGHNYLAGKTAAAIRPLIAG